MGPLDLMEFYGGPRIRRGSPMHSGFRVDQSVLLVAGDQAGIERLVAGYWVLP